MKRHIKLFEEFAYRAPKASEIVAGFSYKWEGEDWSEASSGFSSVQDAAGHLMKLIERARLENYGQGLAWIVTIPPGGEMPEPNFDTARGEVLLEGSYKPIIMLDVAEEGNGRSVHSKASAIQELSKMWDARF